MDNATPNVRPQDWRRLLTILLAQRLELNAIESVLKNAGLLSAATLKEIRTQAADTAQAWSARESDDVLTLLALHSSPGASMMVPESHEEMRRRYEGESD